MMKSEYLDAFKDANGRRPYLPHDHRHSGYRPTRESVARAVPIYTPGKNKAHDEVVDKILEIGARFGLDIHTVEPLMLHLPAALSGAMISDIADDIQALQASNPCGNPMENIEWTEKCQVKGLSITINMIQQMQEAIEEVALQNHVEWIRNAPENHNKDGLTRCLARSELSLEDLTGESHETLRKVILAIKYVISKM